MDVQLAILQDNLKNVNEELQTFVDLVKQKNTPIENLYDINQEIFDLKILIQNINLKIKNNIPQDQEYLNKVQNSIKMLQPLMLLSLIMQN